MDGRPIWTDCDEAEDYVVPNVLSPRDLVFRPDNMEETVPHTHTTPNNCCCQCYKGMQADGRQSQSRKNASHLVAFFFAATLTLEHSTIAEFANKTRSR